MNNNAKWAFCVTVLLFAGMYIAGCKKTDLKTSTTEDVNIVGYLDKHIDSFSLFRQILERTGNSSFLNAYGAYTCFAPTNGGVKKWMAATNTASVEAADLNVLKDMVRFHVLTDTITTGSFKDGKLPVPTMLGQFLVTGVSYESGASSYTVNRQANVTTSNVRVGNGIIHELSEVLIPSALTIAKQLEAKPQYSIFVEAMKATGLFERLNTVDPDTTKRWLTVIAESNQALADTGINSFNDLKNLYSNTGNPANPNDSLYMYVAYHVLSGIKFLGDIITSPSHQTLQPQEVVSTKLLGQDVVVNEVEFNGVLEKGSTLDRSKSDNAATNGVWHDATKHFAVKYRRPTAVFWDVSSTVEEIIKLPAVYRKSSKPYPRQSEADQPSRKLPGDGPLASTNTLTYQYGTNSILLNAHNSDCNMLPMGLPNRPIWWEMTTPPIIKGRYKIWICYSSRKQSSSSNMLCEVKVNGELMQRTMNFTVTRPSGTDSELEAIGWKRYTENTGSQFAGRLVGTYEFKTTEKHTIRLTPLSGTQNDNYLDMIHFIPVDDNQVLPRFRNDGTLIFL